MRNRIRLLVIALLAVLSLAACGNEGSGDGVKFFL